MRRKALRVFSAALLAGFLAFSFFACGGAPTAACTGCPPPLVQTFLVAVAEPSLQSSQLLSFPINSTTGALGSPSSVTGPEPPIVSVSADSQDSQFLYVTQLHPQQGLTPQVYGYSINPKTGALTAIASSPYDAPNAVTLSGMAELDGFLFVGATAQLGQGFAPAVEAFSIGGDGSLSPSVSGSPFAAAPITNELGGPGPSVVISSPYLYATENENGTGGIAAFSVDVNTGVLTPLPGSPVSLPLSAAPGVILYDSLGFIFVTLSTQPPNPQYYIAGYSVNASTGSLTPVPGSPFSIGRINGLALDASGKFLFAGVEKSPTIQEFQVDSDTGALTPLPGAAAAVFGPFLVEGNSLYAPTVSQLGSTGSPGALAVFSINENTGGLTPISGSPFSVIAQVLAMTTAVTISH